MTQQQIALLELALVGGLGAILFITGILIKVLTDRKNSRCTSKTVGKVIRHSFMGDGRMTPVVEYEVGGAKYTCKKRFAGIKKVHNTRLDEPEAWEDEKGYLHVRTGIITNMRQLAQTLWPVGAEMEVYYDPDDPGASCVGVPVSNEFLCRVFLIAGAGIVALGILLYFLILNG
jgi:hypothetical protein